MPLTFWATVRYGGLALPLAMIGLPMYVYLPSLFAANTGLGLTAIGTLLLVSRSIEALADPWIGKAIYLLQLRGTAVLKRCVLVLIIVLSIALCFALLPNYWLSVELAVWQQTSALAAVVCVAYLAYSALTITHHTLGAAIIHQGTPATRVYSMREGLALCGVLLGSLLPLLQSWVLYAAVTIVCLLVATAYLRSFWSTLNSQDAASHATHGYTLWQDAFLKRAWWAYFISTIAGSLPATLLGFYLGDVLGLPTAYAPAFLALYFAAAAIGFAAWPALAQRFGALRTWAGGMLGNSLVFAATFFLNAHTPHVIVWFGAVCIGTGLLLGAELMLPHSIVASHLSTINRSQAAAQVFAWWTFAQKAALAGAAGFGLWGLDALGYQVGQAATASPVVYVYCILPCILKLAAGLYVWRLAHSQPKTTA